MKYSVIFKIIKKKWGDNMSKKLTYEWVKSKVEERGFKLISETYTDNRTKIEVECKNGYRWNVLWGNFYHKKQNCPCCSPKGLKKNFSFVKDFIEKEEGYKVLSSEKDYKNTKSILSIRCPKGSIWKSNYNRFQQGQRCSCVHCANNKPLTYEFVKSYIELQGEKLLSKEYVNNRTPIKIECKKGHIYYPHFNNFKDGNSRCPQCRESRGERKITEFFADNEIEFIRQYEYVECKHKRVLPFDFFLPKYNTLIEYDGKQHYERGSFRMSDEEFEEVQKRDKIKTDYCKENNIKLIRIPYWDFDNIENILKDELKLQYD